MTSVPGIYPDGSPHPTREVRLRILLELAVIILLTCLYLGFLHQRPLLVDVGMALVGMGLVGLLAKETSDRLWGAPTAPPFERTRRAWTQMVATTLPVLLVLFFVGSVSAYSKQQSLGDVAYRLFRPSFFGTLVFYVLFALLQQVLFQFYLLARLRALLPYASPYALAAFNGVLYGLVHAPNADLQLTLLTMVGGIVWSYSYYQNRLVAPIALSHALLGTTYFYWVCDSDIMSKLLVSFQTLW